MDKTIINAFKKMLEKAGIEIKELSEYETTQMIRDHFKRRDKECDSMASGINAGQN